MKRWFSLAAIALGLGLTGGCSLTSPRPDLTKYYVLTSAAQTAPPAASGALVVGLGPVMMPGYLDHTEIVTRAGANELNLSEIDRWAEPIDQNFKNVLARDLSTAAGGIQVMEFPWYNTAKADYKVEIVVSRFDSDQSGETTLNAKWTVRAGHDGQVVLSQSTALTEHAAGTSTSAEVAALSADTGAFAQQIAAAILQIHQRGTSAGD
jgi:uncharacterized lipoprotein YmbA